MKEQFVITHYKINEPNINDIEFIYKNRGFYHHVKANKSYGLIYLIGLFQNDNVQSANIDEDLEVTAQKLNESQLQKLHQLKY